MSYIKQLDSLRAIAVSLVVMGHWIPSDHVLNILPNGAIGVDLFFVLSGFLITRILLDSKVRQERNKLSKWSLIKNFYVRRVLRIFPIYYLFVFMLFAFSDYTGVKGDTSFIYLLTYTQNIYFFIIQDWPRWISHLWSLAVEEQFYVIWPWIILYLNKNYLLYLIIFFILIGVLSHLFMSGLKMSSIIPNSCFDAFGLGALLAWFTIYNEKHIVRFFFVLTPIALISFIYFLLGLGDKSNIYIYIRTLDSVIALWLITYIIINHGNGKLRFKIILNNKFLVFIGKMSYGIYLYHSLPTTINSNTINIYLNPLFPDVFLKKYFAYIFLIENIIILIFISWVSYIFIEKPFLKLKTHFDFSKKSQTILALQEKVL